MLHGFTHKLCLFELFWLQCFHWLTIQHSFSTIYILTDVFFTCVTGLCVLYTVVLEHGGQGGKGPNNFFRGRPPSQPLPPLVVCTGLMLYVLDYLFLSHSTCHIMTYHASCPIFHYMHPFTHSHTHTDTNHYKRCSYECVPLIGLKRHRTYYLLPSFVI